VRVITLEQTAAHEALQESRRTLACTAAMAGASLPVAA